jgi:hypothetical protein
MTPIMLAAVIAAIAGPATSTQPVRSVASFPAAAGEPRIIGGFRSARFRMTRAEVRRGIAADFPGIAIVERRQPGTGTTILQLTAPTLDPGPGPAVVSYVFGATLHTLALVSVDWATRAEATADDRQAIAVAALHLGDYFQSATQPRLVLPPKILRPGTVSLYGALDAAGAGMELTVTGIPYASEGAVAVPPVGSASLRLVYMANPSNPDVDLTGSAERQ